MLAILAMDSYNREYGAGLVLDGTQVGSATFQDHKASDVTDATYLSWQSAGFYASSYTLTSAVGDLSAGTTIIS